MLPGLTATMGVALMTTLTLKMAANNAIIILICMYIGAIYGGSRSAILLNIPGTPANAATCLDGYPLAKQGLAGRAIGIATTGSFLGSVIGMFFLAFFTPLLGEHGAASSEPTSSSGSRSSASSSAATSPAKDPLKGWIAGFIGLFVAMIGQEGRCAYPRFAFGSRDLAAASQLIPAMVGAFGFAEMLMRHPRDDRWAGQDQPFDSVIPKLKDITMYWKTIIRSGIVGTFIGIIPGVGEDIGRVGLLRRRQAREQGEGEVRQGLDRGAHGGRDRRQRLRAGRRSSPCSRSPCPAPRRPRCCWAPCSSTACGPGR